MTDKNKNLTNPMFQNLHHSGPLAKEAFQHGQGLIDKAKKVQADEGFEPSDADFIGDDLTHVMLSNSESHPLDGKARIAVGNAALQLIGKKPSLGTGIHAEFTPISTGKTRSLDIDHLPTDMFRSHPYQATLHGRKDDGEQGILDSHLAAEHAERLLGISMDSFQLKPDALLPPELQTEWAINVNASVNALFKYHRIDTANLKENEQATATYKLNNTDFAVVNYSPPERLGPDLRRTPSISFMVRRNEGKESQPLYLLSVFGEQRKTGNRDSSRRDSVAFSVYEPRGEEEGAIRITDQGEVKSALATFQYFAEHPESAVVEVTELVKIDELATEDSLRRFGGALELMLAHPELIDHQAIAKYEDRELQKLAQPDFILPQDVDLFRQINRITHGTN